MSAFTPPDNNIGNSPPATIFLAAPDMAGTILRLMYPAYQDTVRFQVVSMGTRWEDVLSQVASIRPETLVIDATLAPDAESLRAYLSQLVGTIVILILPNVWLQFKGAFENLQSVRGVYLAPVNWPEIAKATYSAVVTERTRFTAVSPATALYQQQAALGARPSHMVVGTRTIAFTSFAGGTGKSTIAEAVAVELARNHIKTLLCSFNSPPAAVGHMGLRFTINAGEWFNRPTVEGFTASLQRPPGLDDLDVLMPPHDTHTLTEAASRHMDEANSIQKLIFAAYSFNYGAIILDLPPFADSMWAVQPLLAANVVVFVCRATVHDQHAAIRAWKLITEQFREQVRVPQDSIFAVLNFDTPDDNLTESDFQAGIIQMTQRFSPILATFPYVSKLPAVQNRNQHPTLAPECEAFARPARGLASQLVAGTPELVSENGHKSNGKRGLGGLLEKVGIRVLD